MTGARQVPVREALEPWGAQADGDPTLAGTALIVYPTWDTAQGAVRLSKAVSDFGWGARRPGQIVVRLVGIDLGSPFQDVVEGLDGLLANPAA